MPLPLEYFEFRHVPPLRGRPWIALRETTDKSLDPPSADIHRLDEFTGVATAAIYASKRLQADKMSWSELGLDAHRSYVDQIGYKPADMFTAGTDEPLGINLVIDQIIDASRSETWHLHPDLVVALGLQQEGDCWYRPAEGWIEVVRLKRDESQKPVLMEMRSEFLADYLAARAMALYCSSYRERIQISKTEPAYCFPDGINLREDGNLWEGITTEARYPDPDKMYWTRGALWRTEWFEPGTASVRVRGDKASGEITFALKSDGTRASGAQLQRAMAWLHFEPTVVTTLLRYRGSILNWHSMDTGGVGAASAVHFGINDLGHITVFAKDIDALPTWEQRLWCAHNITPDGRVSRELFAAQMEVNPAATVAPEKEIGSALKAVDGTFHKRFGKSLLRDHESINQVLRRSHRFQASETDGLLELSKELTRLFAERIDLDAVVSQVSLAKGEKKPGSLKAVEKLVSTLTSDEEGRGLMAPLFGIYDLRNADSHLGSGFVESGKKRAGIDDALPAIMQGRQLLHSFVATLQRITAILG